MPPLIEPMIAPPPPAPMIENNGVYEHPDHTDGTTLEDGSPTLLHMIQNIIVSGDGNSDYLGTASSEGKIVYQTYDHFYKSVLCIGDYLTDLKKKYKVQDNDNKKKEINGCEKEIIGIFSVNRAEWLISENAIYASNSSNCPLYSTFGKSSVKHILKETEMKFCFLSKSKADSLFEILKEAKREEGLDFDKEYLLKAVIVYDRNDDLVSKFKTLQIEVAFWDDIINENGISSSMESTNSEVMVDNKVEIKRKHENINESSSQNDDSNPSYKSSRNMSEENSHTNLRDFSFLKGEDVATVCYTSGTSGTPKGVLLSHLNFISTIRGFFHGKSSNGQFKIKRNDVYISYLPLAHVMERVCTQMVANGRGKIAFFRGNPKILAEDMKMIKPTFLVGVPRVFNVFKEKIEEAVKSKSCFSRLLFNFALNWKIKSQKYGIYDNYILDNLIFKKVSREFGGKIRASLNGSAPISKETVEFLQAVLSIRIFQGYGQTEGTAANILAPLNDFSNDRVGIPFPTTKVKLIPTDCYNGTTRGEICLKGNNVSKGYFKRNDLTKELFTEDGWLRTGDIGEVNDNGVYKAFKIVGRRKEIFKTSNGEYVVPEKIENELKIDCIDDILIAGRPDGNFIVALVVCKNKKLSPHQILKKITEQGLKKVEEQKLTKFEIPREIYVLEKDFMDYDEEMLTPTMKKKRNKIEEYFKDEIDKMYELK